LDLVEESLILFQKVDSPARSDYAQYFIKNFTKFSRPPIIERNNTIFNAFRKIATSCNSKYVMVLEEDFALFVDDRREVAEQLLSSISLIENQGVQAVRMRRRKLMGDPDYVLDAYRKNGVVVDARLFSHVAWQDYAEDDFPERFRVCMNAPKAWCTDSYYADYTNNPTMYRGSFLRDLLSESTIDVTEHIRKFESQMTSLWRQRRYGVGWVGGLFTHQRLDRTMVLPARPGSSFIWTSF
jgi:hypothetical protein